MYNFQYNLTLVVSDSLLENSTTVRVRVKDVNDLPPKFSKVNYLVTIDEEMREKRNILQVTLSFLILSFNDIHLLFRIDWYLF